MAQAFYRKWRPQLWDQVVGQEHIVHTLQNAIRGGKVGHAYLFSGPRGTGKTTTARLLAKAVNCLADELSDRPCDQCAHCKAVDEGRFLDLIEIDAASNTSVDDIRDLRDKINFAPSQGRYKVYIIDEVHMLSTAAFNALLKTLEEPPAHAIFILATTEVHKIPATVLSRCQRHEFRRIPVHDIVQHLHTIATAENLQVEEEALILIARQSTGAMRDAISLLDQLASTGEKITLENAQKVLGTATNQVVVDLVGAILASQADRGLDFIHQALDSGTDPRQFARQVVEYLRSLLLVRMGNADQVDATTEMRAQMAAHASQFDLPTLLQAIKVFNSAANEGRSGWQPSLMLELALTETLAIPANAAPVYTPAQVQNPEPARSSRPSPAFTPAPASQPAEPPAPRPDRSEPKTEAAPVEAAAAPQAAVQANAPAGEISLQAIHQNWAKICAAAKARRPQAVGLLNSVKNFTLKDGVLVLGFATEVVRSKMDGENLEATRQAVEQVLGVSLLISSVVANAKAKTLPDDLGVDADGMVGTALNLGGKIVDKD
ncbi:DNA polymerase III, subunit gamma and tau [Longilinea arvoryzae]|uniref:DNA polymerase III subunit gamma/tau n=1 Tax=Longilinea arvoryzae TaxID=360412 RepID=A0A0S7BLB5_9CHLR|nr:DNA polymerase III subunit gamma/tau [Longilinea arvoryzae]GAP15459.1 DNA polymerase III, subunit gamma and tau [Longilinea arvoryzae]